LSNKFSEKVRVSKFIYGNWYYVYAANSQILSLFGTTGIQCSRAGRATRKNTILCAVVRLKCTPYS